jgi:probable HAF family extracellular repeat protein
MQYLGDLRGTYPFGWRGVFGSVANGINDSGDVVGRSGIQDGTYGGDVHAFLKESGQPMVDLNTLIPADSGWTITSASAINNDGQIAANGYKDGGGEHALLLTPTIDTTAPTAMAPKHSFTTLSTLGTNTVPVKLTWSATDNTGGSGIASYQLQQSVNAGAYTNVTLPSATATTISRSLAPGTTYRYRVAAKDKAGNLSAWASGPSFKVSAYQESSSAIVDTGSWTTSALSGAYGGSVQSASALGRNATFTVPVGSKNVEWVSYRGNRGKAQVWLDGVQQDANPTLTGIQPFDLYSSSVQARKVVFSKAVSTTTSHKLEVRVLGQKNASSTSTRVDIDAFVTTN